MKNEKLTKEWLDRLVQRFEVTKKIYETYLVGFSKKAEAVQIWCAYTGFLHYY